MAVNGVISVGCGWAGIWVGNSQYGGHDTA